MAQAIGTATFSATDTATFTWSPLTGNLSTDQPKLLVAGVEITDSAGPVSVSVPFVNRTGGTVSASGAFTGTVSIIGAD